MRTVALPMFRKLYGRIEMDLKKNDTTTVMLENNYNIYSFGGKRKPVLSTTSWFGGKNDFLGIAYLSVGGLCLFLTTTFTALHLVKPRVINRPTIYVTEPLRRLSNLIYQWCYSNSIFKGEEDKMTFGRKLDIYKICIAFVVGVSSGAYSAEQRHHIIQELIEEHEETKAKEKKQKQEKKSG